MPELAKTYDPVGTEARWQQAWDDQGAFHPDPKAPGEPFSVVIPPPNVTGSLHMGHAFNTALIDTNLRYQRPWEMVPLSREACPDKDRVAGFDSPCAVRRLRDVLSGADAIHMRTQKNSRTTAPGWISAGIREVCLRPSVRS